MGLTQGWTRCRALLSPQSPEETVARCRHVRPNTRLTLGTEVRGTRTCTTEKPGGYVFHWFITSLGKHFWFCHLKKKPLQLFLSCCSNSFSSSLMVLGGIAGRGATKTSPRAVDAPVPAGGTGKVGSRWKAPFITSALCLWLGLTWPPGLYLSNLIPALVLRLLDRVVFDVLCSHSSNR